MHPGMIVTYKVRPLLGVPILWVTEITRVEPKRLFIDEQRFGPYRFWHHQHWLHPVGEGRVRVEDIIHYALPLSFLTTPFHGLLVKKQLSGIFNYRSEVLSERFGSDEELTLQFT